MRQFVVEVLSVGASTGSPVKVLSVGASTGSGNGSLVLSHALRSSSTCSHVPMVATDSEKAERTTVDTLSVVTT